MQLFQEPPAVIMAVVTIATILHAECQTAITRAERARKGRLSSTAPILLHLFRYPADPQPIAGLYCSTTLSGGWPPVRAHFGRAASGPPYSPAHHPPARSREGTAAAGHCAGRPLRRAPTRSPATAQPSHLLATLTAFDGRPTDYRFGGPVGRSTPFKSTQPDASPADI